MTAGSRCRIPGSYGTTPPGIQRAEAGVRSAAMIPEGLTTPHGFAEALADLEFDIGRISPVEALSLIEALKSAAALSHSHIPTQTLQAAHGVASAVRVGVAHRAVQASRRMVVLGSGGAFCAGVPAFLAALPKTALTALALPLWLVPVLFCFGLVSVILGILHKPDADAWGGGITKAVGELVGAIEKALDGRVETHGPYRFPTASQAPVAPPRSGGENAEAAELEAERSSDTKNRGHR